MMDQLTIYPATALQEYDIILNDVVTLSSKNQLTYESIFKVLAAVAEYQIANENYELRKKKYSMYQNSEEQYFNAASKRALKAIDDLKKVCLSTGIEAIGY